MTDGGAPCVVNIALKRIQEFLFTVPRLKAMIGANALLGETIRKDLVDLVIKNADRINITEVVDIDTEVFSNNEDALKDDAKDELSADNPTFLYKNGILSRDGGHFKAAFQNHEAALVFATEAQELVLEKLAGVQIEVSIRHFDGSEDEIDLSKEYWGETPARLPQFQICQDTGNELANDFNKNGSPEYTSNHVKDLEDKCTEFRKGKTKDIIGLLMQKDVLPKLSSVTCNGKEQKVPEDLSDLAGKNGYIAVIHADGNGMGVRRAAYAGNSDSGSETSFKDYLCDEIENEKFFYGMRTSIRVSVIKSLHAVFTDEVLGEHKTIPYQLLMLGGDDLLLITQPQYAFPFVVEYSQQLLIEDNGQVPYEKEDEDTFYPVSIGAGIAVGHHKVPFYHLHGLAEKLAGSAKSLYRSQALWEREDGSGNHYPTPDERSVVDWLVATTSWVDSIEDTRRLYDLNEEGSHCTTAKPYFVLKGTEEAEHSFCLETLWNVAESIHQKFKKDEAEKSSDENKLSRSQLKNLLQNISRFNVEKSEIQYSKISSKPQELTSLFDDNKTPSLWRQSPPQINRNDRYITQYKDLIELIEIHYLGQETKSNKSVTKDKGAATNE